MADFSEIAATASGSAAWAQIQGQLNLEGASDAAVLAAKDTLASTWTSLTTNQFGVDPEHAMTAARDFTLAAQTISGSVATVEGLVNAAGGVISTQQVVQISNMFVGTMIGLAAAAGAVSAGVGAVIVSAIAIAANVIESFLGSSPGIEVCPGVTCNPTPNWVINCHCVWGQAASPSSLAWRPFPTGSEWYTVGATAFLRDQITGQTNMEVDGAGLGQGIFASQAHRPIDMIFPQYAELEQAPPSILAAFHAAFVAAWKANQEYAINGLKVQDDSAVLFHMVRVWNRSHSQGTPFELSSSVTGSYEATLVNDLLYSNSQSTDLNDYISGTSLLVYTGPAITFGGGQKVIALHLTPPSPNSPIMAVGPASSVATSAGMSTGSKIALSVAVVGAAAAGGVGIWAFVTHQGYGQAWSRVWRKSGGKLLRKG
jgi:hypothetical protein